MRRSGQLRRTKVPQPTRDDDKYLPTSSVGPSSNSSTPRIRWKVPVGVEPTKSVRDTSFARGVGYPIPYGTIAGRGRPLPVLLQTESKLDLFGGRGNNANSPHHFTVVNIGLDSNLGLPGVSAPGFFCLRLHSVGLFSSLWPFPFIRPRPNVFFSDPRTNNPFLMPLMASETTVRLIL